jgi:hypothetical protein
MKSKSRKLFALFLFGAMASHLLIAAAPALAVGGEVSYTGINTGIFGDDSSTSSPVNLGFSFNFYEEPQTQVDINLNGTLNFDGASSDFDNVSLPTDQMPKSIMAFWDDLITQNYENQSILTKTIGSPGSREFIVQWTNMYFYDTPELPIGTFQAILHEGSDVIQLQYRDVIGGNASHGSSATIGLNYDANKADQFAFESNAITPEQAISFTPNGSGGYTIDSGASYDPVYLTEATAPEVPVINNFFTADGATDVSRLPFIAWTPSQNADNYRLVVADNPNFLNPVLNRIVVGNGYTFVSYLDSNTTYYWKVEAINNQASAWSATYSFSTVTESSTAPDPPNLTSPADGATGVPLQPDVTWDAANNATSYRLYVAEDPTFTNLVFDNDVGSDTHYDFSQIVSPFNRGITYYWRVEAFSADDSTLSDTHSFEAIINRTPDIPVNFSSSFLLHGSTISLDDIANSDFDIDLADPDNDQVQYQVQFATDANFTNIVIDYSSPLDNAGRFTFHYGETGGIYNVGSAATTLTPGQDYFMRIRAYDDQSNVSDYLEHSGVAFTAAANDDHDGSSTAQEDAAPNGGDANNDGSPDSDQPNVTSFLNTSNNHYTTVATTGCLSNNSVNSFTESQLPSQYQDPNYSYAAGLLSFQVACSNPGDTVTVNLFFYGIDHHNLIARKLSSITSQFTNLPGVVISNVTIGGQQATKVSYSITDGSSLDDDGLLDGNISDPFGLGVLAASTSNTPSNSVGAPDTGIEPASWSLPMLSLIGGGLLLGVAIRRRDV